MATEWEVKDGLTLIAADAQAKNFFSGLAEN